jgi:hypothetical protein
MRFGLLNENKTGDKYVISLKDVDEAIAVMGQTGRLHHEVRIEKASKYHNSSSTNQKNKKNYTVTIKKV